MDDVDVNKPTVEQDAVQPGAVAKQPKKRIIVTPAGRGRYLEVLYEHLKAQRGSFDQWLLLMNTNHATDIGFCERLAARNEDWIDTRYAEGSDPNRGNLNIHVLLNAWARDPDTVYLRLDDDVVFLGKNFVETMFQFRLANPEYFLVYGNIINNAIVSWIHQKLGNFEFEPHSGYNCTDGIGWNNPQFAKALHEAFLRDPTDPKWTSFERWIATEYERVSINAISWFGKDLADVPVGEDEEQWFSVHRPSELKRRNAVCGRAVCVHYAFHPQRDFLDNETDVLAQYKALAP